MRTESDMEKCERFQFPLEENPKAHTHAAIFKNCNSDFWGRGERDSHKVANYIIKTLARTTESSTNAEKCWPFSKTTKLNKILGGRPRRLPTH